MPRSKIPFHPGATQDYEEAYVWYFAHGIGLAAEFEREIDRDLRLIAAPLSPTEVSVLDCLRDHQGKNCGAGHRSWQAPALLLA